MQLLTAAAVPTRPRDRALPPRTPRPQGRHQRDAAQEQSAPGAPLSGSSRRPPQRAGSALAFVLASSFAPRDTRSSSSGSAPPPTHGLRRAPRATRRLCRVSSRGGGNARSHVSRPRSGERWGSERRREVYGRAPRPRPGPARQRAAPGRLLSRRRPRAARQPSCVSPSRGSQPARLASLPPPPPSRPAGPSARSNPCASPALGGLRARSAHLRRRRRPSR